MGKQVRAPITKRAVDGMKPGDRLVDADVRGFVARCLPSGVVTYGLRYRDRATGKQRWLALGLHGQITPEEARRLAKQHAGAVAAARDPQAERQEARAAIVRAAVTKTVNGVLDDFLKRHVRKSRLRTADEIESVLKRLVRPEIGHHPVYALRRVQVVEMLDRIEDRVSARQADKALAIIRKAFSWYATRDGEFNTPIVPGMARTKLRDLSRDRILTDDEIRVLWGVLGGMNPVYGRILQMLLRTGQRLNEVAALTWLEIEPDSTAWTIPAHRYKTKLAHSLPIIPAVTALLGERPEAITAKNQFVFSTTRGAAPFSGFSRAKANLDAAIALVAKAEGRDPPPAWRVHDLRRTARSLMARAGVSADHAERVLGHAQPGVAGIYDRHAYEAEKRSALVRLNALIDRILNPHANVTPLERGGKQAS
ncbi:tyrosine-type recombinase/integrase [Ferrovibrio sp.]|uniref:tyrosine-type recombinase/integrase n=1 Tax=Ferrovibrio sp. TaxID=1917215 RepID=UPI0035B01FEF